MDQASVHALLTVDNLTVVYQGETEPLWALENLSFSLTEQEFVCVLGPSGSGKSTLLRVLAGILEQTGGSVTFSPLEAAERQPRAAVVFQQANLMPWRPVLENITLPLELDGVPQDEARARAAQMIALTGLQGFEKAWPRELSGGMAQRVALGRALIQDPDLLLLDEPFGALDALTRERMGSELLRIWQARRKTVLMVTHSISEALLLSDRVLVLTPRPGHLCLDLCVDLPRPRQDDMRYTSQFGNLARELKAALGV